MIFEAHSDKQETFLFSEHPISLAATGIQWGKTTPGAVRLKMRMHEFTSPDDNFLLLAPNYKIMQQSSLPAFLKIMEGYGKYRQLDASFKMNKGGTCWMRTATDPDSIVGITNVRHIWGDEAGKFPLYFWQNIQARASFMQAQVDLTTSPYSMNWVYKELIKGVRQGIRPDVLYVTARSDENPYFPKEEYERKKATMDPRKFNMIYGGQFERMEGLVYDVFDERENMCLWPEDRKNARFFAGIDWGYTEPLAMVIHMILPNPLDPKTFLRYQVSEVKKARLTLTEIIEICRQKRQVFGIEHFFADPSQPGYIEELNRAGIPCSAANNDIKHGVALVYEEFKTRRLKLIAGTSPHTIDELETYHYPEPEDVKPDKDIKEENPVGQNDHAMDALRYLVTSTLDFVGTMKPVVGGGEIPPANNYERVQRLLNTRS